MTRKKEDRGMYGQAVNVGAPPHAETAAELLDVLARMAPHLVWKAGKDPQGRAHVTCTFMLLKMRFVTAVRPLSEGVTNPALKGAGRGYQFTLKPYKHREIARLTDVFVRSGLRRLTIAASRHLSDLAERMGPFGGEMASDAALRRYN
jgi:hypothetical protein